MEELTEFSLENKGYHSFSPGVIRKLHYGQLWLCTYKR